jgi:hypothetical protein
MDAQRPAEWAQYDRLPMDTPGTAKLLPLKPKSGLTYIREYEACMKASHFKDTLSVEEIYVEYFNKH